MRSVPRRPHFYPCTREQVLPVGRTTRPNVRHNQTEKFAIVRIIYMVFLSGVS
jgi:hypothetical protein